MINQHACPFCQLLLTYYRESFLFCKGCNAYCEIVDQNSGTLFISASLSLSPTTSIEVNYRHSYIKFTFSSSSTIIPFQNPEEVHTIINKYKAFL